MTAQEILGSVTPLLNEIERENVKITDIKITPLTYKPADGSYLHECGPIIITKYDVGIAEIYTDQGIKGIGPARVGHQEDLSRFIGKNPFDILQLSLPAGLDVACWDIIGKTKGVPVYELLATDNDAEPNVPVYASGGVMWTYYDKGNGTPFGVDALIGEVLQYKAAGFDTFKWRPGTDWEEAGITPAKLGDICVKLRDAVGPEFNLGLEKKAYDSWTFEECMEIAPIINELNFLFFEQPMGDQGPMQFEDYRKIKAAMPNVMLWGGESFRNLDDAHPWLAERVYDAVQSDCYRLGITENWKVGRVAGNYDVELVTHNWSSSLGTMCNTHLIAGLTNGLMCEFFMYPNAFRYGLFKEPYRPVQGIIALSEKPGFGMELIDEPEKRFPYIPGPNTFANPRYPHAWARAKAREKKIRELYSISK